ncbi:MAG TPA: HAMP domain-containing sensor histidine kinase, partial [Ktedonobacterales bacterium]
MMRQGAREATPTRELARVGLDEEEAAMLLSRAASPLAELLPTSDMPNLLEWVIYPLPSAGAALPVLIAACEPASLERQQRVRGALEAVAPGVAAAVAAALREELIARGDTSAEQLKAELIGTVSHELRSPLAAVMGYAMTLLRSEQRLSRQERQEFLQAILSAGERLVLHIDRMLEMAQLAAGELPLRMAPIDLAQLAREALAATGPSVARIEPPITLRLRLPSGESGADGETVPLVWADARRLRDVLDHLIENAIKYSPQGGEVEVALWRAPLPAVWPVRRAADLGVLHQEADTLPVMVELCVRDGGIGIPPEHLERIFERFHRVDTRLTRAADGLGLGLAICKRIIELHGGAIWAESTPGVGSTFHIMLPAAQTAGDVPEPF